MNHRNMQIGDRIKLIREKKKLSQALFGEELSLERSAVSLMERNQRNVTERTIKDICRVFGVNEKFIRDGYGDIFISSPSSIIAELTDEYSLDTFDQSLITEYLKLDKRSRTAIKNYIKEVYMAIDEGVAIEKEFMPAALDEEGEEWSEFNKGLTREEMHRNLDAHIDASKKGDASFMTSAKDGSDSTLNLKRIEGL